MALAVPTTVTGYSGFWSQGPLNSYSPGYSVMFGRSHQEIRISRMVGTRGFRKYRSVMRALHNGAVGAVANDSYKRVQAVQTMNDAQSGGGKRNVETVTSSITTTAPMLAALNARIYDPPYAVQTYPVDKSTNSGGGRLGK